MQKIVLLLTVAILVLTGCGSSENTNKKAAKIGVEKAVIEQELTAHLHQFYPRIIDTINGGYYTNFEYDWTPSPDQQKMLVTQARGLWTAARAAAFYPEETLYKKAADHGFQFLTQQMWDTTDGGFFQYYPPPANAAGMPAYKMTYGNAFALYALAEYAKINPAPEVLQWLKKSFDWMENEAHDPALGGYYNLIFPDSFLLADTANQSLVKIIGWGDPLWKDQNTSIHIMEALTNVYRVWPEALVKKRLTETLQLIRDTMVSPEGSLHLNFTSDWKPISHRDSSRAYIMEQLQFDHCSFGHDIETAYLLMDASEALYGQVDEKTLYISKKLVDHTLANGFATDYYGLYDRGYQFAGSEGIEIVDRRKSWWAQAEAWHALALMTMYFPEQTEYQEACQKMWQYIDKEVIDHQYGGWYYYGLDESPENKKDRKAQQWKGAYHDGRAMMQVLEYY